MDHITQFVRWGDKTIAGLVGVKERHEKGSRADQDRWRELLKMTGEGGSRVYEFRFGVRAQPNTCHFRKNSSTAEALCVRLKTAFHIIAMFNDKWMTEKHDTFLVKYECWRLIHSPPASLDICRMRHCSCSGEHSGQRVSSPLIHTGPCGHPRVGLCFAFLVIQARKKEKVLNLINLKFTSTEKLFLQPYEGHLFWLLELLLLDSILRKLSLS